MNFYLDTNVFLSAIEPIDPFHQHAQELLRQVELRTITATTSTETYQEIIHVAKKQKRLAIGIKLCQTLFKLIPQPLPIDTQVIHEFLSLIGQKSKPDTRDHLHIAVCLANKIPHLVTEDETMLKTTISHVTCISMKNTLAIIDSKP